MPYNHSIRSMRYGIQTTQGLFSIPVVPLIFLKDLVIGPRLLASRTHITFGSMPDRTCDVSCWHRLRESCHKPLRGDYLFFLRLFYFFLKSKFRNLRECAWARAHDLFDHGLSVTGRPHRSSSRDVSQVATICEFSALSPRLLTTISERRLA
jgi:hypothetical protein